MNHPLNVQRLLFILAAYLPRIGEPTLCERATVTEDSDTEHVVLLGESCIGIQTGYGIAVRVGHDVQTRDGYRVFLNESHGGRSSPPETVDRTLCATLSINEVLQAVAAELAKQATQNLPDLPAELVGDMVVEAAY